MPESAFARQARRRDAIGRSPGLLQGSGCKAGRWTRFGALAMLPEFTRSAEESGCTIMTIPLSIVPPVPRYVVRLLVALCLLSLLVKALVYCIAPNLAQSDETFQYLEQAHRLVYGTGLIPWEFLVGLRSWLLPALFVPATALGRLFGGDPEIALAGNAAACALLSLSTTICGGLWGWRKAGIAGAIIAGALNAFWFESVYYADHALSEPIAADFLVAALYLGYPGEVAETPRRLILAGVCFGAALAVRLQLGPAIAVSLLGICRLRPRAYLAAGLGVLGPVLMLGLVDWATWGRPFQSVLVNFQINYVADTASRFGTSPWYQYAVLQAGYWSYAAALIALLAVMGARRLPLLFVVVLVIYGIHAIIPHKEARFVFPALPLLLTLVGIATAEILSRPLDGERGAALVGTVGALLWIAASAQIGSSGYFARYWQDGAGMIAAMRNVNAHENSCGLALAPSLLWWRSGGYTRLRPGSLTLYGLDRDEPDAQAHSAAYSDIISIGAHPGAPTEDFVSLGFNKESCWDDGPSDRSSKQFQVCLWRRAGSCEQDAVAPLVARMPRDFDGAIERLRR